MRTCHAFAVCLLAGGLTLSLPANSHAASCTVRATQVKFGNYDPLSVAPLNRTSHITVNCRGAGSFVAALSTGDSGSYNPRYMLSLTTADQLDYNLYTDAARTIVWGDGSGGSQTVSQPFNNNRVRVNVYAQIPAQQDITPGTYSDTIDVVVTF